MFNCLGALEELDPLLLGFFQSRQVRNHHCEVILLLLLAYALGKLAIHFIKASSFNCVSQSWSLV